MATRIGVDIGGTFTDLVLYDDATGAITVEKVPTTPAAPEIGCIEAVRRAVEPGPMADADYFLHGTTVGLNALLERRGAVVGLLTTSGFRDSLEIRRGSRPEAYDLLWSPAPPLVPRHLRQPVVERIGANGEVLQPLDPESVRRALAIFAQHGVDSIAVCFINAYANPVHEIEAERVCREAGFKGAISLSHRLSREYRDYERTSTTVIDAFVRNRMSDYLQRVERGVKELGFGGVCLVTRSGGGSMSFDEARDRAFETIMSGPVAGAEGAAELSRALSLGDLVTADVGGTSFDTALIVDGRPRLLYQGEVADMPIQAEWVDVRSIGAGGGSIAWIDAGGLLQVGPQSAGADPGPACYRRGGTQATVTDAAFYLGMMGEGRLASGLTLDRGAAEAALAPIAKQLGYTVREAAIGIIRIACSSMANAIREITIEQGVDPRRLKLLVFGGAGPMLATQIARELDIDTIIVPAYAGNFSAWGLLGSDLVRTATRTHRLPLSEEGLQRASALLKEMFSEIEARGADPAFTRDGVREVSLGMRYIGQEHSLAIPVPHVSGRIQADTAAIENDFREAYLRSFGVTLQGGAEIITLRAAIRKQLPRTLHAPAVNPKGDEGRWRFHSFALGSEAEARTYARDSLPHGEILRGPAILYESTTTTYVDADFSFGVEPNGLLYLRRERSGS